MSALGAGPQDAGTVPVRVQVIDMDPFSLDLVVPTYLAVSDLTQRVARDAGLGAYWEDGTRRIFYLRARGRVLQDHEKLDELGIVPYELLHLLPQPPLGSGVQERPPEYPESRGYAAGGNLNMVTGLGSMFLWMAGWILALSYDQSPMVSVPPSLALAMLCTSFSRHMLGGEGSAIRVPLVGLGVYLPMLTLSMIGTYFMAFEPIEPTAMAMAAIPALIAGVGGVLLAWLAWYGPVEPLPERTVAHVLQQEQDAVHQCGVCGLDVQPDVRSMCQFNCGRAFHTGCVAARQSVYNGDGCAVCGWQPGQQLPA